jgi:hypothetical protein
MLQNLTKTGHKTEGRTILTRREEERNLQPWRPQLKRREMNHEPRRGGTGGSGGTRRRAIKISARRGGGTSSTRWGGAAGDSVILLDDGGWGTTSVLRGEDSVRCSQGATRAQRVARGGGGAGSRITAGEDSGCGGRSCQAEAELTSNRGLVLRREGQRGWRGGVAGLPRVTTFTKKKESRGGDDGKQGSGGKCRRSVSG